MYARPPGEDLSSTWFKALPVFGLENSFSSLVCCFSFFVIFGVLLMGEDWVVARLKHQSLELVAERDRLCIAMHESCAEDEGLRQA